MKTIAMIVPEVGTGCAYYRSVLPAYHCMDELAAEGIKIILPQRWDQPDEADAYVFYRALHPHAWPVVTGLKSLGKVIAWDCDDNFLAVPTWNPNAKAFTPLHRLVFEQVVEQADFLSVSTDQLQDVISERATVLPNLIDASDYLPRDMRREVCTVLWAGTPTHQEDLRVALPALKHLRRKYNGKIRLVLAGYCPDWILSDPELDVTFLEGTTIGCYPKMLRLIGPDVAICPLAAGDALAFNECKSPIKWMEMTLAGASVVASDVGPYADAICHGITGFLADGPDEFLGCLDEAVELALEAPRPVHKQMLRDATADVITEHSWTAPAMKKLWLDYFRSIAERCPDHKPATRPWRVNASKGVGKIGDTALMEPALSALAEESGRKVEFQCEPWLQPLFFDHPHIIVKSEAHESPDFDLNCVKALDYAHRNVLPFSTGYFPQLGLLPPTNGLRLYRSASKERYELFDGCTLIIPYGYSCVSRDNTKNILRPGVRPNIQPPSDWWDDVINGLDGRVVILTGDREWDWNHYFGVETIRGLPLRETMAAMRAASCMISVNTGLLHLASGTRTPTVFLSAIEPALIYAPDCPLKIVRAPFADEFDVDEVLDAVHSLTGAN